MDEGINHGVARVAGLKENLAWAMRPAGAPCDLKNQLCRSFGGPEIAAKEAAIHIQNANQGDIGEVVSFGQHLGADQDVRFSPVD